MERRGIVVEENDNVVSVLLHRHSACSSCHGCSLGNSDTKETIVKAINKASAKKGDYVALNISTEVVTKAAITAYGIPLLLLITFVAIGNYLNLSESSILGAIVLSLIGSYFLNKKVLEPKREKNSKYDVAATRIVNNLEQEVCHE
jgi:positive regulator of sigma E activity